MMNYRSTVDIDDNDVISGMLYDGSRALSAWYMNTQDKQIRAGLIALGWTPPEGRDGACQAAPDGRTDGGVKS